MQTFSIFGWFFFSIAFSFVAHGIRVKRQTEEGSTKKEETFEQELCKDKDAGEWFRLVAGEGDNCRDVIQCTSSVSNKLKSLYSFTRFIASNNDRS